MGKALYRKYRSKSLDEIIGQEHVTTTLANALKKGSISHAYLLTGPRGVGKTSIARILAHEVNKLPYSEESTHLDIIEIDAASNNGVEHVRDLRDKAYVTPSSAAYKVYIIDEVHMLSKPAFNALLKILEEPPAHVIFILATTETHKLPETIISRTQRFTFKPVERSEVVAHLKSIAKAEKLTISDNALSLIAEHGGGSFRDSISLLDQVSNTGSKVELEDVQRTLGIAPEAALNQLIDAIAAGSTQAIVQTIADLRAQGYQAAQLAKQLAAIFRSQLMAGTGSLSPALLTRALKQLLEVPAAYDPETMFEITLIEIALQIDTSEQVVPAQRPTKTAATKILEPKAETDDKVIIEPVQKPIATKPKPTPKEEPPAAKTPPAKLQAFDEQLWDQVLAAVKRHHNTLYSVVRMAVPSIDGDNLTLTFSFAFHQRKINDSKPKQLIAQTIHELTGKTVTVSCVVDKASSAPKQPVVVAKEPAHQTIDSISNIFGGAEVLES